MSDLATAMKNRTEGSFKKVLMIESPDGDNCELEIFYKPASAYKIATIYEDMDQDSDMDEVFNHMADLFQATITNIKFVNVPEGTADYEHNEMSVQDLTIEQRMELEAAVAPGVGKIHPGNRPKPKANRRKVGKGMRK